MSIPGKEKGQYRIQAVSEMTGVPAATLRAWERRYGIPTPSRTATAYRLYGDEDVAVVRRMKDLCERGMAPAEAARLLRQPEAEPARDDADAWTMASRRIEEAVLRWDAGAIEDAVRGALVLGSATQIFERVIAPTQVRIGDLWHEGTVTVAQEHLCSEILHCTTRDLLRLVQREDAPRTVLLGCFAAEEHVLPLHGAAFRFASWGYRIVLLGARTPPEALASAVAAIRPDLVGLSVSITPEQPGPLLRAYAIACAGTPWFVGGRGAALLGEEIARSGGMPAPEDPGELRDRAEAAIVARRPRWPGAAASE